MALQKGRLQSSYKNETKKAFAKFESAKNYMETTLTQEIRFLIIAIPRLTAYFDGNLSLTGV